MGQPVLNARAGPQAFDIGMINLEGRIAPTDIVGAIVRSGSATVLMSGPPGTGKTQLASHLAHCMGRALLT